MANSKVLPPRTAAEAAIPTRRARYYFLIEFTGEGSLVEKLEKQYRRDERVIRFLSFRQDKDAVAYSIKRRNKLAGKVTVEEAPAAAEAEVEPVAVEEA